MRAKAKLAKLVNAVQPIVDAELETFDSAEVNYILTNYRKYLMLDLARDFEKARGRHLKESPFDSILDDEL